MEEVYVLIKISNQMVEQIPKKEKAIKRVYCLYRVSTKNQAEANDIPLQRVACHQFADSHTGWIIRKEFYEFGVSGFKVSASDRDKIQELKACAERGEFDVLLVFMYDRLGRRDDETPFVLRWFYENGIEVWSVKEGQKVFDSSTDDLLNYVYFWTAKVESVKTAMRVRTKLRQMVSEGKYTGGTTPFGYQLVHSGQYNHKGRERLMPEVLPDEANIVRMIFRETVLYGMGSHILAEKINDMGILTHNGAKFQSITINRILRNPIYCGYFYRGGVLSPRIDDMQIIDDSLYNEAQRVLDNKLSFHKEHKSLIISSSKNLLSGNVYCSYCGEKMCASSKVGLPVCEILKEINADARFEKFEPELSLKEKTDKLISRLDNNLYSFLDILNQLDFEDITQRSERIAATWAAHSYMTDELLSDNIDESLIDHLLSKNDPLQYLTDHWPECTLFGVDVIADIQDEIKEKKSQHEQPKSVHECKSRSHSTTCTEF